MALLLWIGHWCFVVPEADLVAEYGQVDCVFHLFEVLEVEDVALGVDARCDDVADGRVRVFIHYFNVILS